PNHEWRKQRESFDNTREEKCAPRRQSGEEIVDELQGLKTVAHGKNKKTQIIPGFGTTHNWKKSNIFFQLPYWKTLLLRHNLDVMHIEKNIFDNVVGTIMNIDGKTKDSLNLDLQAMDIRKAYWPREEDDKLVYDPAPFELSAVDIKAICEWLLNLKVPDGYCANVSHWINANRRSISGMKSHDCHVFLERLLQLVVQELLPKKPCEALIELSYFFRELCAKVLRVSDLEFLENKIAITLCMLEMIFPPAFFDIMVHLSIHLAWEAKVCGTVQYRWMYPIERYLHKLNTYVRNKACPEGSIAEGYLAEECITFCSRYLRQVKTKFNRVERNYDGGQPLQDKSQLSIFSLPGKTIGTGVLTVMTEELHHAATHYVLTNCDECLPFIEEHKDILRIQHGDDRVDELHKKNFVEWFSKKIQQLYVDGKVSVQMRSLAQRPGKQAVYYKGYNIHGFRFHTVQHDVTKKTQNSGVMVKGDNQINCVPWYGTLTDVVELWYTGHNKVLLFHCNWFDTATKGKCYKEDRYGILSVNNKGKLNTQEPFVLASQATQVYYVEGIKNSAWSVVVETKPRNVFECLLMKRNRTKKKNLRRVTHMQTVTRKKIIKNEYCPFSKVEVYTSENNWQNLGLLMCIVMYMLVFT
ncbi:hypothetical protein ABKV19_004281, partial [Rosa sericea]